MAAFLSIQDQFIQAYGGPPLEVGSPRWWRVHALLRLAGDLVARPGEITPQQEKVLRAIDAWERGKPEQKGRLDRVARALVEHYRERGATRTIEGSRAAESALQLAADHLGVPVSRVRDAVYAPKSKALRKATPKKKPARAKPVLRIVR